MPRFFFPAFFLVHHSFTSGGAALLPLFQVSARARGENLGNRADLFYLKNKKRGRFWLHGWLASFRILLRGFVWTMKFHSNVPAVFRGYHFPYATDNYCHKAMLMPICMCRVKSRQQAVGDI